MGAFAWEFPGASDGTPEIGFTSKGPRTSDNIAPDLREIAAQLNLSRHDYSCPGYGPYVRPCDNIFFEAWRSYAVERGASIGGWIVWSLLLIAIPMALLSITQEWMVRRRPYWMRCRCLFLRRYCPCPKGTKEEIEALDDFTWDKVRLAYWVLTACYFILPALHESLATMFFLKFLGYIDGRLPEGWTMNARRGTAASTMLWCASGFSTLSALCMLVKWRLSRRPKGWMEEQSLGQLEESTSEEDTPRYTD